MYTTPSRRCGPLAVISAMAPEGICGALIWPLASGKAKSARHESKKMKDPLDLPRMRMERRVFTRLVSSIG